MGQTNFLPLTLVARKADSRVKHAMEHVIQFLESKAIAFFVDENCNHELALGCTRTIALDQVRSGLLVSVGGDGSLLRLLSHACLYDIPVVGIHCGNVGFLSDITLDNLTDILAIVNGEYAFESRSLLGASYHYQGQQIQLGPALNEFNISSAKPGRLIRYSLSFRDNTIAHHQADGVIVATPTGSTAYALSAGGPILTPAIACNLVLPVCPHKLSSRPIIYPNDVPAVIQLKNLDGQSAVINFDGHEAQALETDSKINIFLHQKKVTLSTSA